MNLYVKIIQVHTCTRFQTKLAAILSPKYQQLFIKEARFSMQNDTKIMQKFELKTPAKQVCKGWK